MGRLDDKVCIVTGASSGIGARTAELFAAEGAKVAMLARRGKEMEAIAKKDPCQRRGCTGSSHRYPGSRSGGGCHCQDH